MRALLIPVGRDWYAVELRTIREVLEPRRITRLPDTPVEVLGLVNMRGEVVPVLDTGLLLGLDPVGREPAAIVVASTGRGPAGLAASAVPVADQLGEDLGASTLAAGSQRRRASVGPVTVIDLEAVISAGALAA